MLQHGGRCDFLRIPLLTEFMTASAAVGGDLGEARERARSMLWDGLYTKGYWKFYVSEAADGSSD